MKFFMDIASSLCREEQLLTSDLAVKSDETRLIVGSLRGSFGKPQVQAGHL